MSEPTELYKHPIAILAIVAGIGALYVVYKTVKFTGDAADQLGNVTKKAATTVWNQDPTDPNNLNVGTAYAGTGPIGSFGDFVDKVLFGVPSSFGSWVGRELYDELHPDYDPSKDTSATDQNRNGNPFGGVSPRVADAKQRATPDATAAPSTYANVDWYTLGGTD